MEAHRITLVALVNDAQRGVFGAAKQIHLLRRQLGIDGEHLMGQADDRGIIQTIVLFGSHTASFLRSKVNKHANPMPISIARLGRCVANGPWSRHARPRMAAMNPIVGELVYLSPWWFIVAATSLSCQKRCRVCHAVPQRVGGGRSGYLFLIKAAV